jgi:nitroreductase
MDVLEAIKNRHCIRAFLNKSVDIRDIHTLLETARFAPSAVNTQPWQVMVLAKPIIRQIGDSIIQAKEKDIPENPDYLYYPTEWYEPYKSRRKACGLALYSSVNITLAETEKRKTQWYRNYYFFGAPVGLLFFLDQKLEKGSWIDMGTFIQNVMLAAKGLGLDTCPQAALAEYPDIVRNIVGVTKEKALMCGMALGYADPHAAINQYRTTREPIESFTQFLGF